MTDRLRGVVIALLAATLVGAPADALAGPSAPLVGSESSEPPARAEGPAALCNNPLPVREPVGVSSAGEPRSAAVPRAAAPFEDHVPRHVRLCVWRE